jgi:hypothetical protein
MKGKIACVKIVVTEDSDATVVFDDCGLDCMRLIRLVLYHCRVADGRRFWLQCTAKGLVCPSSHHIHDQSKYK